MVRLKEKDRDKLEEGSSACRASGWGRAGIRIRVICGAVAVFLSVILAVAFYVHPDTKGFGSHRQLNLPECGWITQKNMPCPTCGMTTAYSLTIRGRLLQAVLTQPAGAILALCHIILTALLACTAVTGKYPVILVAMANYHAYRLIFFAIVIVLAGWGWTILRFKGLL